MTIQEKIDALKKEFENKIAELEKQAKAEEQNLKQSKVWKPKKGERYFYIDVDGDVTNYHWEGCDDEVVYSMDNCFRTEEEAEWEKQHRIVATELKHFVAENDPRPITEEDWKDKDVFKYFIEFDYKSKMIYIDYAIFYSFANQVYASNAEVLDKAIEHIGEERLKKYYFGVGK